jgi:hypothetical protein
MSGDGPSGIPLHRSSKISDQELLRRPSTPPGISSPRRSYHPSNGTLHSPELTPVDPFQFASFDFDTARVNSGLRRTPTDPSRRYSGAISTDQVSQSISARSRRLLRGKADDYHSDRERERERDRSSSMRRGEFSHGSQISMSGPDHHGRIVTLNRGIKRRLPLQSHTLTIQEMIEILNVNVVSIPREETIRRRLEY